MSTFTYDLTTLVGKTRFHCADTDVSSGGVNAFCSDEELSYCLTRGFNVPELAAATALRAAAADRSKIAIATRRGQYGTDESKVPDAMLRVALELERKAPLAKSSLPTDVPTPVFTLDTQDGTDGTMDGW